LCSDTFDSNSGSLSVRLSVVFSTHVHVRNVAVALILKLRYTTMKELTTSAIYCDEILVQTDHGTAVISRQNRIPCTDTALAAGHTKLHWSSEWLLRNWNL